VQTGKVEEGPGDKITVESGTALDAEGRFIVLPLDRDLDLPMPEDGKSKLWCVVISYFQEEDDQAAQEGLSGMTRWLEKPYVELIEPAKYE
jgi:hypothetical protein